MADSNWSPSPFRHLNVGELINRNLTSEVIQARMDADLAELLEEETEK